MKFTCCVLIIYLMFLTSCKRIFRTQVIKGSIKELASGNPISNQDFEMDYETTKSLEHYESKTDANGNFKLKNVANWDNASYHFKFKNFHYVVSDFNPWFNFYINEGVLVSKSTMKVSFSNSTSQNDTLIIKFSGYAYYNGFSKTLVGPFPIRLTIPISDTVENYCSYKNDGIEAHEVVWKFRNQSGNIILKDNYLTGIGTIDSLNF